MTIQFLVVIGSYERILYGIDVDLSKEAVKVSFAIPAHSGMIKSIAASSDFLATGSTDDTVRLFDICKRKELGTLTAHSSPVISLEFLKGGYLMAAEEQGRIAMYSTKDWECVHVFKASNSKSKKNLADVACHPSAKLFMALNQDGSLKCWDLKRAKLIGKEKITMTATSLQKKKSNSMEKLVWSTSGKYYAVLSADNLVVFQTKGNQRIKEWSGRQKMTSCLFYDEDYLLIVGEGSRLDILNVINENDHKFVDLKEQSPRIKDFKLLDDEYLITGASNGIIAFWKMSELFNAKNYSVIEPLLQHSSSLRITCIDAIKTFDK